MKLTDCFEKVFVINLPFKQDRRERLERHLVELDLADPDKLVWVRAISGELCSPPAWFEGGAGAWGCLQSHLRIAQDATMDDLEHYCVLEDDVLFSPHAPGLLKRLMAEAPQDWGQLYLGGQHLKDPEPLEDNPFILRCTNINRTHAFALRKRAYAAFQQHVCNASDYMGKACWHIDHQLGLAHEKGDWPVYAPAWWLAGQEEGSSSICGQRTRRLWWHNPLYRSRLPFVYVPPDATEEVRERLREVVHFGNNLKPSTVEDIGLDACVDSDEKLLEWLEMIAREAMDYGLIPGLQHPAICGERVVGHWKAGTFDPTKIDVENVLDYPFNGLFEHPAAPGIHQNSTHTAA